LAVLVARPAPEPRTALLLAAEAARGADAPVALARVDRAPAARKHDTCPPCAVRRAP
jgi:hypothetical protein